MCSEKYASHTFADFKVNRVFNVLDQFLAASSLFKNKSLEMEHQHRGQFFQSHPPTDLNLKTRTKNTKKNTCSEKTCCDDDTILSKKNKGEQDVIFCWKCKSC